MMAKRRRRPLGNRAPAEIAAALAALAAEGPRPHTQAEMHYLNMRQLRRLRDDFEEWFKRKHGQTWAEFVATVEPFASEYEAGMAEFDVKLAILMAENER